jgi:hypothetical protein
VTSAATTTSTVRESKYCASQPLDSRKASLRTRLHSTRTRPATSPSPAGRGGRGVRDCDDDASYNQTPPFFSTLIEGPQPEPSP